MHIDPNPLAHLWWWIEVHTGTAESAKRPDPSWYGFWSGFGSDLSEILAPVLLLLGLFRKHKCHTRRCLRLGKHSVDGTPFVVCPKCHPTVPDKGATRGHIHALHREHKANSVKVDVG